MAQSIRTELARYIETDLAGYLAWYEGASLRNYLASNVCSLVTLIAGVGASVTAALIEQGTFAGYGRILLVVLPAIGSLASVLLTQFRFAELEDLRERGRIHIADLVARARLELAAATDDAACKALHERLLARVLEIEEGQHRGFRKLLRPKQLPGGHDPD